MGGIDIQRLIKGECDIAIGDSGVRWGIMDRNRRLSETSNKFLNISDPKGRCCWIPRSICIPERNVYSGLVNLCGFCIKTRLFTIEIFISFPFLLCEEVTEGRRSKRKSLKKCCKPHIEIKGPTQHRVFTSYAHSCCMATMSEIVRFTPSIWGASRASASFK